MATWQFRAWIVPADRVTTGKEIARRILEEDAPDVWTNVPPGWGTVLAEALTLPTSRVSWSPRTLAWGTSDGTNVSELVEEGAVLEVGCNFDVRALDFAVVEKFATALQSLGAVLVTAEGTVIEGDLLALLSAIVDSRAFRFVQDPTAFLDEIANRRRTRH